MGDIDAVAGALAAQFDPSEVKWKPQTVKDNRALVICFVDARVIQDRLDDVLGVMGWQDSYECLPDGAVVCRLRIRVGDEWITKEDVGGQSEQPDEGDRRKAAFSDALKRAAVKFGIGRYLYRLKPQWVDYDPQKRQVVGTPRLPAPAQPAPKKEQAAAPTAGEDAKLVVARFAKRIGEAKSLSDLSAILKDSKEVKARLSDEQAQSLRKLWLEREAALKAKTPPAVDPADDEERKAIQANGGG
jgi:hypothetical protein